MPKWRRVWPYYEVADIGLDLTDWVWAANWGRFRPLKVPFAKALLRLTIVFVGLGNRKNG